MKYIFIILDERNGEYEYSHKMVREIPARANELKWVDKNLASCFYGGDVDKEAYSGYYFHGGEVFVSINTVRVIGKEEYDIMRKYF